jgi:hypothetical protein
LRLVNSNTGAGGWRADCCVYIAEGEGACTLASAIWGWREGSGSSVSKFDTARPLPCLLPFWSSFLHDEVAYT